MFQPALKYNNNIYRWTFTPSFNSTSPYFSNYYLWTSPKSKIVGIAATSDKSDIATCKKHAKEIMEILKTKYHKAKQVVAMDVLSFGPHKDKKEKFFEYHFKLKQSDQFIELSCLADLPLTNKHLDHSGSCYSSNSRAPYIEAVNSNLSEYDVYSIGYIIFSNQSSSYNYEIWGYPYNEKRYRPIPGPLFRKYKIPSCADVRLAIRYGNTQLESATYQEIEGVRTSEILNDKKASGL